jgi:ABC-type polysaccharide/polyol phosphate transport system ATPase subunit
MSKLPLRSLQQMFVSLIDKSIRGSEYFWALNDVSFDIFPGETVGLVGTNGSGKSTALKLISRIIDPTHGTIAINGRLSALLELGAGFHPDLTGRENIFLNGSILGITRSEMNRKLDNIVGFADIGDFIDVPTRNLSSGMQMRLAFLWRFMWTRRLFWWMKCWPWAIIIFMQNAWIVSGKCSRRGDYSLCLARF